MHRPTTNFTLFIRSLRYQHWRWVLIYTLLLLLPSRPLWATEMAPGEPPTVDEQASFNRIATTPAQRYGLTVNPQNREEVRNFFLANYQPVNAAAHNWDGDIATCNAGATAAEFRNAIALRINYYRAMAGVPADITLSDEYNQKAQQAALMMSANKSLSHDPPANWRCYSEDGHTAAGKSNLALGAFGPRAIDLYMQDAGANNDAVGHRRWLLYPQTQLMGSGDLPETPDYPAANALWVIDDNIWAARPATREEFVAWPPPGYTPYEVVFPRWSFSYPHADFTNATITMNQNETALAITQAPIKTSRGENTLVWIPTGIQSAEAWARPAEDTTYQVTIANVLINDTPRTFSYTVIVFDPTQAPADFPPGSPVLYLPLITNR